MRKNRSQVAIFLVSGIKLEGTISGFDQYSVLLTDAHGNQQLVYKAKISTIAMHSGRPQVSIQRARKPRVSMAPRPTVRPVVMTTTRAAVAASSNACLSHPDAIAASGDRVHSHVSCLSRMRMDST